MPEAEEVKGSRIFSGRFQVCGNMNQQKDPVRVNYERNRK
jgi:hypothetical protein